MVNAGYFCCSVVRHHDIDVPVKVQDHVIDCT